MAKKDVLVYYTQCTDQLIQLNESLKSLKKLKESGTDLKGNEEYLENIVGIMKDNCEKLSYIVFLLNQPLFDFKKLKYLTKNKDLVDVFKKKKIDKEGVLKTNSDILDKIRDTLKVCEEVDNGKESK